MDEEISTLEQTGPPKERDETDVQGNNYEFYVLLQRLKSGGMSFDTFLEQALEWATR